MFRDHINENLATIHGSPVSAPSLVVGGGNSYIFNGNDNFSFSSSVFQKSSVTIPFTLEAWFKPVNVTGPKGIIGHSGQVDGLWFDGEAIHFTTDHGEKGSCTASYCPPSITGSFHVVGVHTGSKNELYINGVRVSASDLNQDQISSDYRLVNNSDALYVGHLSGAIVVDCVAVYSVALTGTMIMNHFRWGRNAPDFRSVVTGRNGNYWTFTDDTAGVAFDFKFDTDEEWFTGETTSVSRENNMLLPAFDQNGLTRAGDWQAGIILGAIADKLEGSKIEWDSDGGVTVMTSIDGGNSWSKAINGREVAGISRDYSTAGQSLEVKVLFPAGESVDTITKMRSLSIKLYSSRISVSNVSGLNANFTGHSTLANTEHQPIEHEDRAGVHLYNSNALIDSKNGRTVEMWINLDEGAAVDEYIMDARPGSNVYLKYSGLQWSTSSETILYINGERKTGAAINIFPGRWTHLVFILPVATNDIVNIGDKNLSMHIGMYASYEYAMNDIQVRGLYNAYFGVNSVNITEASGIRISDLDGKDVKIYSYPWTLTASG